MNGTDYVLPTLIGLEENTKYFVTVRASTVVGYGPVTTLTVLTPQNGKLSLLLYTSNVSIPLVNILYSRFQTFLSQLS